MRWLRRMWSRGKASLSGRDEQRLREEIADHIAQQTEEFVRAGLSPQEARRRAILKFGAVEAIKEEYRDGDQPCCRCGTSTNSGIYYRRDPLAFKCLGEGPVHAT